MFFQSEFIYSINSRKLYFMGNVYAEIELINESDLDQVRRGEIDVDQVRKIRIMALVDTGAINMAINENIQECLQLPVTDKKRVQLANGQAITCDVVNLLKIRFENRECSGRALVLPGDSEPLLGVIPLEDMDLIVDPLRRELAIHPDRLDMALGRL